jgi:hypothetical protein
MKMPEVYNRNSLLFYVLDFRSQLARVFASRHFVG